MGGMPYVLGIDLGGSRTTAAVCRWEGNGWSRPEPVRLAADAYHVPSVLRVAPDGALVVGDRVTGEPALGTPDAAGSAGYGRPPGAAVARGFTRRIGDDVPLAVGGEVWTAEALAAVLAMWVVERVMAGERGTAPEQIVVGHPPDWGGYRRELLHRALWEIGLSRVTLLPEPVAAAESHAAQGFTGRTLAVCSLAEEEFSAAVVGRAQVGFELLGCLEGGEPLGIADLDEALVRHVLEHLRDRERERPYGQEHPRPGSDGARQRGRGRGGRSAPWSEPAARAALPGLARACAEARQRLTVATETDVRLHLPDGPVRVPVTRAEFEELARPALRLVVDSLVRTVRTAGLRPGRLDGVLLVGAAARMPLLAELVSTRLPAAAPVTVEADPTVTVATGAAWAAAQIVAPSRPVGGDPEWPEHRAGPARSDGGDQPRVPVPRPGHPDRIPVEPPARPPVHITPLELPRARAMPLSLAGTGGRASRARTRS